MGMIINDKSDMKEVKNDKGGRIITCLKDYYRNDKNKDIGIFNALLIYNMEISQY